MEGGASHWALGTGQPGTFEFERRLMPRRCQTPSEAGQTPGGSEPTLALSTFSICSCSLRPSSPAALALKPGPPPSAGNTSTTHPTLRDERKTPPPARGIYSGHLPGPLKFLASAGVPGSRRGRRGPRKSAPSLFDPPCFCRHQPREAPPGRSANQLGVAGLPPKTQRSELVPTADCANVTRHRPIFLTKTMK